LIFLINYDEEYRRAMSFSTENDSNYAAVPSTPDVWDEDVSPIASPTDISDIAAAKTEESETEESETEESKTEESKTEESKTEESSEFPSLSASLIPKHKEHIHMGKFDKKNTKVLVIDTSFRRAEIVARPAAMRSSAAVFSAFCTSVTQGGKCRHGDKCRFAHTIEQWNPSQCRFDSCTGVVTGRGEMQLVSNPRKPCTYFHEGKESKDAFMVRRDITLLPKTESEIVKKPIRKSRFDEKPSDVITEKPIRKPRFDEKPVRKSRFDEKPETIEDSPPPPPVKGETTIVRFPKDLPLSDPVAFAKIVASFHGMSVTIELI
jgi:hypothetical protein